MTAEPQLPAITCPSSLVASCAPLLGFTPEHCVVAFVLGAPDRSAPVLVRVDLPAPGDALGWADEIAASIAGVGGDGVDLVGWVDTPDQALRTQLPSAEPLSRLDAALSRHGIPVPSCISTNGRVWWGHDCPDDTCCGPSWPLDPGVVSQVQAEYVYAGFAPLPSRGWLVAQLEPQPHRVRWVAPSLASRTSPRNLERWRDVEINYLTWLLVPGGAPGSGRTRTGLVDREAGAPVDDRAAARVLRGFSDVRVRDTVLRRLVVAEERDPDAWQRSIDLLTDTVRCAPPLHAAPAATLLALVAWMRGQGALATVALDRAEEDRPGYRLAALSRQVIARGLDPEVWRHGIAGLSEARCRGGQA